MLRLAPGFVYQLKITLKHSKPQIWRRVLVRSNLPLTQLHLVIQQAMGWENAHPYEFIHGTERFGQPDPDWPSDLQDVEGVRLGRLLQQAKDKLLYWYDFGDDWLHTITLEKILSTEQAPVTPLCIAGKRACPPEDCGGLPLFYQHLHALQYLRRGHRLDQALDVLGEGFDPEEFYLEEANERIAALKT